MHLHSCYLLDPDLHSEKILDPDPQKMNPNPQNWVGWLVIQSVPDESVGAAPLLDLAR